MALNASQVLALEAIFSPERVLTDPADCWVYGYDNSKIQRLPEAVVFPLSHEETLALVRFCNQEKSP